MLLSFDPPKKVRTTNKHNEKFSSDSEVDGTYVPNMSDKDNERWKGKRISGTNERIEIRRSINGTQLVIVVRKYPPLPYPTWKPGIIYNGEDYNKQRNKWMDAKGDIKISMNGSLWLDHGDWVEMGMVIDEARKILTESFAFWNE